MVRDAGFELEAWPYATRVGAFHPGKMRVCALNSDRISHPKTANHAGESKNGVQLAAHASNAF